jgi:hypothetical protein
LPRDAKVVTLTTLSQFEGTGVRNRRITGLILLAALLMVAAVRHPSADIRILTHDSNDRSPVKVQAALDLGVIAVSVLVTWSKRLV